MFRRMYNENTNKTMTSLVCQNVNDANDLAYSVHVGASPPSRDSDFYKKPENNIEITTRTGTVSKPALPDTHSGELVYKFNHTGQTLEKGAITDNSGGFPIGSYTCKYGTDCSYELRSSPRSYDKIKEVPPPFNDKEGNCFGKYGTRVPECERARSRGECSKQREYGFGCRWDGSNKMCSQVQRYKCGSPGMYTTENVPGTFDENNLWTGGMKTDFEQGSPHCIWGGRHGGSNINAGTCKYYNYQE